MLGKERNSLLEVFPSCLDGKGGAVVWEASSEEGRQWRVEWNGNRLGCVW